MPRGVKNFLLDILFPKFCLGCKKEGTFLCKDCEAVLDVQRRHQRFSGKYLSDLYWALSYENPLVKTFIHNFKYEPFVKELAKPLSKLILNHFQLIENPPPFLENKSFILVSVPLSKKRLKWRGFNQAEEIGKELSSFLKIPLISNCLIKIKETSPQVDLPEKKRKENVVGAFLVKPVRKEWRVWDPVRKCWFSNGIKDKEKTKGKKVLLVDDVFTTGSTMEECAKTLKKSGAKEVIGIVIARG